MLREFLGQAEDGSMDISSARRLKEIVAVLRDRELLQGVTPVKVRQVLEDLGPTFVKLGQIISMRPDFLPNEYQAELTRLQSEVKPMDFSVVKEIVQREYNQSWDGIFASIDEHAMGSASIAQVHRASLLNGDRVVIKVQRPGIYEVMAKDIALLKKAISLLNLVRDSEGVVNLESIVDEMWEIAKQEMDFLLEADHIEEFAHLNKDDENILCPKVNRQLTTQRILVMECMEGIPLDDGEGLQAACVDMERIGRRLGINYVKQMIDDGFFHADPHPGNIWVKDGRIIWLDLGMMGRLSVRDRNSFRHAIMALVTNDVYGMKEAVLALGMPRGKVDHIQLYDDVSALMAQYGDLDFEHLKAGEVARKILMVLKSNNIAIPHGFSMFARGVMIMEGVMTRCCPQVNFSEIFAKGLRVSMEKDFSWLAELNKFKRDSYMLMKKSMQLPEQISDILKMTLSGQTKVNLDLTGSQEPLQKLDSMINKMIMAIISAALLLGSSTICTTQMEPKIMEIPLLGVLGYLAAMVLCSKLLWSIIKTDRRK
ncbi:AarF/ABC1/UbiB kinase family protein [Anaerovibrio slackiae]|uniref:AarF/ABC1/UbiB kinase family protein n=1 Tax=Anaerovibrio slackiae TaxID=2652309 RepID=A0A6I2UGU2_9FIRM|nr:AarF/UbiB family protein [Anaerovibrio slackiae]MCI6097329.1 AarF/UbiB family protein [Selenomonadaceae bacterium]MSU07996.1 AarF/ABC1/UbiB kinase family protein [Anaerovibrio slackiae]